MEKNEIEKIKNFIWFWNLKSKIWFVWIELWTSNENWDEEIKFLSNNAGNNNYYTKNIIEYHKEFYCDFYYENNNCQKTYCALVELKLLLDWNTDISLDNKKKYIRDELWKKEALLELFPVPEKSIISNNNVKWDKNDYYKKLEKHRLNIFQKAIKEHKPKKVIFYGKTNVELIEKIIWTVLNSEEIKMENGKEKTILFFKNKETKYFVIDHFVSRWWNGHKYLKELADFINKKSF